MFVCCWSYCSGFKFKKSIWIVIITLTRSLLSFIFILGHSVRVPCKQDVCRCKAFAFIPGRPEDIGEFWFQRRRNFDPSTWRAKCKCKHTHEQHDVTGLRRCKTGGRLGCWSTSVWRLVLLSSLSFPALQYLRYHTASLMFDLSMLPIINSMIFFLIKNIYIRLKILWKK